MVCGVGHLCGYQMPNPFWPGHWLWFPIAVSLWATVWTYWKHGHVNEWVLTTNKIKGEVTVVQLSDIHACPTMTGAHLHEMVQAVNALNPDLVLITGDHVMPFSEAHHHPILSQPYKT